MTQRPFCKGPIEPRRVEHIHRWQGEMFILRNVPADVCTQCSEAFFGPDALRDMEAIASKSVEPQGYRSVPVYSL